MTVTTDPTTGPLDAGAFGEWVAELRGALHGERDADVPCGECDACCRSSQFVHIAPDEADALAHIPAELLFPAPRAPRGHVLMGYDARGRCPMLTDTGCSIYAHRPRTCRTYDCRVFAATDVSPDDDGDATKADIARRARRWRFEHPAADDRARHDASITAARYLVDRRDALPEGIVPPVPTQLAVLAVELHQCFLDEPHPTTETVTGAVQVALTRRPH